MSGSDSDATWPATDDFRSRFLEVDEYEQVRQSINLLRFRPHRGSRCPGSYSPTRKPVESHDNRRLRNRRRVIQDEDTDTDDERPSMGSTRSASKKSAGHQSTMHPDQAVDEEVDSEEDRELFPFRNPKLMTARQLSLKMQRSASAVKQGSGSRSRGLFDPELLTLESLEPPKPVNKPTPEQLLARQQRTARRRESAKRKVEMQKQQTVERLLKINANSVGLSKRGRGRRRGPMGRLGFHPFGPTCPMPSSTDLAISDENDEDDGEDDDDRDDHDDEDEGDQSNGNSQRDTSEAKRAESAELSARLMLAEQHSLSATMMDPHPGYIRWLSSSKLTPANRVCVGPGSVVYPFSELSCTPVSVASRQLCALGCGRFKRYTCSTTGRPLCSLSCYKQSMANFSKVRSTEQSCA